MLVYSRLRELVYATNLERERRGEKLLTQTEIATATGMTHKTINLWMNGGKPLKRLDTEAWVSIAVYLGIHPNELLRWEGD